MGILPFPANHHRDDDVRPYGLFLNGKGNGNASARADDADAEKPDAASLG